MISSGTPKAKAFHWGDPDAEGRKRGHKKGLVLDTHGGIIKIPVPHLFIEMRKLGYIGENPFVLFKRTIPREAQETYMNVKGKKLKSKFRLSDKQKFVLIGTLLGDGSLAKRGRHCRLFIKHSANQRKLIEWKYNIFKNIVLMPLNYFTQEVSGKKYQFIQFVTLTHPVFDEYRKIFYRGSRKIIPTDIDKIFYHPLALAVLLMDDGANDTFGLTLQTHSFKKNEVRLLSRAIKKNFKITTSLRKNKGKWIIYFPKKEIKKLYQAIEKYLLLSLQYKFPIAP